MVLTAKEYLKQLSKINRMIENNQNELLRLREQATSINSRLKPVVSSPSGFVKDNIGETVSAIIDAENEVKRMIDALTSLRHRIKSQLEGMDNPIYYDVLSKIYLYEKSVPMTAKDLGYSLSWTKQLHRKALSEFDRKYGREYH